MPGRARPLITAPEQFCNHAIPWGSLLEGKWRFQVRWDSQILQNDHFLGIPSLDCFITDLPLLLLILHTFKSSCQVLFTCHRPVHEKILTLSIRHLHVWLDYLKAPDVRHPLLTILKEQLLGSETVYSICFKRLQHRKCWNIPQSMHSLWVILCHSLMHAVAKGKISQN